MRLLCWVRVAVDGCACRQIVKEIERLSEETCRAFSRRGPPRSRSGACSHATLEWLNEARDPVLRKSPVSSRARHVGCPLKGAESTTRDRHRRERGPCHHRGVSAIVQIITKHSSQKKQRERAFFQRRCCQDTAVETRRSAGRLQVKWRLNSTTDAKADFAFKFA